jgi:hypothetical protein
MARSVAAVSILLAVIGCGPKARELAPVSGKVMLDGRPLINANVAFIPQATAGTVGHVTSRGRTDAQGKYTLKTAESSPRDGAVVGKHRVQISTKVSDASAEYTEDQGSKTPVERVPAKYNSQTELSRDVPREGSSEMNFELTK